MVPAPRIARARCDARRLRRIASGIGSVGPRFSRRAAERHWKQISTSELIKGPIYTHQQQLAYNRQARNAASAYFAPTIKVWIDYMARCARIRSNLKERIDDPNSGPDTIRESKKNMKTVKSYLAIAKINHGRLSRHSITYDTPEKMDAEIKKIRLMHFDVGDLDAMDAMDAMD
jgi:hypothetical protein